MSIINRIDEFFLLNKNKEQSLFANQETSVVNPHQQSFSVGTTYDSQQKSLQDDRHNSKEKNSFKEDPLSAYKELPNCQKDLKDLTNVKGKIMKIPIKGKDGKLDNQRRRFQLPKMGYLSSSSLQLSSSDDDDGLGTIKESSTEQLVSQKKKEENMLKEPSRIINKAEEEPGNEKREEYKEDRINKIPNEKPEIQQGKNHIMFADIHEAKSVIYLPVAPTAKEALNKEDVGAVVRFAEAQDPLESYKKKKNAEKVDGNQAPQQIEASEKVKEGPLNLALELLKKFPLKQLSLIDKSSFDKNVGNLDHYLDLCCLANQDPVQFYRENFKEDPSKLALEALGKFPLEELRMTLSGFFDRRFNLTHDYLNLCLKAGQDPLQYYKENFTEKQKMLLTNSTAVNLALDQLRDFPLDSLRITMKGFFDRRFNATHEYLSLCTRANKDPLQYYNENLNKKQNEKVAHDSCTAKASAIVKEDPAKVALEQLGKFPLGDLRITLKGFFDRRYNVTHAFLDLCQKAGKDPLQYYYENLKR